MKHKFLPFLCLISCFTFFKDLQAQSTSMELNKTAQYQILPLHNGSFMVAEIINMDQYQRGQANFILYDSLCKDQSNKIISLPWQPVFNGSVSAGNLKIVSFFSAVNNKTVFLTMDSLGQQVNRKEIEVKKAMQIPSLTAFSSPDGFFIISRSEKQWKDIIITKLDFQYNLLWERKFKQEKDPVTIDKLEKIGDKIFIFKQISAGSKKYQGSLIVLDEKTGNTLLEKSLTSNQVIKTPTAFMVEGENILVAGLYVKGNLLKDSHCGGVFLSSYTPSGQVNFETLNSWQQEVKQGYIKGGIEASWINEQSTEKAILQSIKKTEKGYMVLAESFKKVFNGADAAALIGSGLVYSMVGVTPFINPQLTSYKVMDMLLYDFDTKGMLQQVKK